MSINKINARKSLLMYLPFAIFFLIIFIWHLMLPHAANDDLMFSKYFHNDNIINTLAWRYGDWSSRWVIELFLMPLAALPKIVWNFLDSVIFLLMAVLIPRLTLNMEKINEKKSLIYNSLSCILLLIYIYSVSQTLSSAGYISTTLNYTWPLFFGLLHFYLLKKYVFHENNLNTIPKIFIYLVMIFALIFAINQEIMLVVVTGAYFFIILYCLYNKIKIPNPTFLMLFIIFLGFLNVYLSPGNVHRYHQEVLNWFPDYSTLNFINKVDLGITVLFNKITVPHSVINILFLTILGTYVYSVTRKKISILIISIPILIMVSLGLMTIAGYTPIVDFINAGVTKYGLLASTLNHILINSVIYAIILLSLIYALVQIWKYNGTKLTFTIFCLLALGFASQMMRGFTPTSWATGDRWEIYYYFFILLATYILSTELVKNRMNIHKDRADINKDLNTDKMGDRLN
jgi:hypothetical protein